MREEQAWEKFVRENAESSIYVQQYLNINKEPVKPPAEVPAYCQFELDNKSIITIPLNQMVNITETRWGGENGDITTIYGGYS